MYNKTINVNINTTCSSPSLFRLRDQTAGNKNKLVHFVLVEMKVNVNFHVSWYVGGLFTNGFGITL